MCVLRAVPWPLTYTYRLDSGWSEWRTPGLFVLCCRLLKDSSLWYLVKWRDLPYDQATWEAEDAVIPELNKYIEEYYCLR